MKENVLDVLMYLFENYMDQGPDFNPDQEELATELSQAGFRRGEINKAFSWLEGLSRLRAQQELTPPAHARALRVYCAPEQQKLGTEARGFLLFLEQNGVIDPSTREVIIDRVMALEEDEIDLEKLKWVILMVLFNQPGLEHAYAWMEDLVFNESPSALH